MSEAHIPANYETWDEFSWHIENEGFHYYFTQYSSESFEDPMLRDLALEYVYSAKALKDYIKANCTEEGAF